MNGDPRYGGWTKANILDIQLLKAKLAAGADVQKRVVSSEDSSLPLGWAARYGSAEACRLLIEAGADPNHGFSSYGSPLLSVVEGRKLSRARKEEPMSDNVMRDVLKVLVSHGANPNGCLRPEGEMRYFDSPLFEAVRAKDHAMVRELVRLGADVDIKIQWDKTDLAFSRTRDIATPLVHLADITGENGKKAVGDQDMMLTLLRLGADDARLGRRYTNVTPFQESVTIGRDKLVEYYVRERGEDLAQRVEGRTLAQVARNPGTRALLKALRTELEVQQSMEGQGRGAPNVEITKRVRGVELL